MKIQSKNSKILELLILRILKRQRERERERTWELDYFSLWSKFGTPCTRPYNVSALRSV